MLLRRRKLATLETLDSRTCAMLLPADATARDAAALHALLCDAESDATTIDCRQLERCDAAGLQMLVAFRDALAEDGRRLVLTHVPADLRWYFALVGLEGFIMIDDGAAPATS